MRRSALLTIAVLGGLVCLLGGSVLHSALQDTARTGVNSAESAALGASTDIQLARATLVGPVGCEPFSDDLTTGLFAATEVSPGFRSLEHFCIKNVGTQPVTVSALTDEITDVDVACTGDEASNGDATCGGDQLGELSKVMQVLYFRLSCATAGGNVLDGKILEDNATAPIALGVLAAAETGCYSVELGYGLNRPAADVQKAQSDRVTWRLKFTAQSKS